MQASPTSSAALLPVDGDGAEVRLSDVLAGLSTALDLTEGQRPGHAVRSCAIGMRIAEALRLPRDQRSALFYALLMKDLGCSSNAARFAALFAADDHGLKARLATIDWPRALESFRFVAGAVAPGHFWLRRVWQALAVFARGPAGARDVVLTRCERGADIAGMLGFSSDTAGAIRALDEHWDGRGQPYGLKGDDIPLLARILCLSQTVEVYFSTYGVLTAFDVANRRRGSWFDPEVVAAFLSIRSDSVFWQWIGSGDTLPEIGSLEPPDQIFTADEDRLDVVAEAFARVIDAKSPWTYRHSNGVASLTADLAAGLGFSASDVRHLRRAALLHDLGKLGISNLILDKPEKLSDAEFGIVRQHPANTERILRRVGCFRHLADVAASHHERLDGRGYHRGLAAKDLPRATRLLCAADICDALRASRPYREGLETERVLSIMRREIGVGVDPDCFQLIERILNDGTGTDPNGVPAARVVPSLAEDYHQAA
jgi:putative nucleotidyltransferase with HDIG domain